MKITALIATLGAAMALCFGAWGRFTAAGRLRFDEMAGILPFASWYAGIALALLAAICWGLHIRQMRRRDARHANPGSGG